MCILCAVALFLLSGGQICAVCLFQMTHQITHFFVIQALSKFPGTFSSVTSMFPMCVSEKYLTRILGAFRVSRQFATWPLKKVMMNDKFRNFGRLFKRRINLPIQSPFQIFKSFFKISTCLFKRHINIHYLCSLWKMNNLQDVGDRFRCDANSPTDARGSLCSLCSL